jgi:hypothetical protein
LPNILVTGCLKFVLPVARQTEGLDPMWV